MFAKVSKFYHTHPFIFLGLSFLIFVTIILVIAAININRPTQEAGAPVELTGSQKAYQSAENYEAAHPIIAKLPIIYAKYDDKYNYTEFRIDGGIFDECESDFCLKITDVTGGNFDIAKELLIDKDINPEKYQILYEYKPITPLE